MYGNEVERNIVLRNGVKGEGAGILIAAAGPGMASYDNEISGNDIGRNNVLGDPDAGVTKTTGILIFSAVVPTSEIVKNNRIHDNQIRIWTSPNVTIH